MACGLTPTPTPDSENESFMTCQLYLNDGDVPFARIFCGKIVIDIKASWRSGHMTARRARNAVQRLGFKAGPWVSTDWGLWCKVTR